MDNRTTSGWLKKEEITETHGEALATGKVIVLGYKPTKKEGIQLHLAQLKTGVKNGIGTVLEAVGFEAANTDQLRMAWQAVDKDSPIVAILDDLEEGATWEEMLELSGVPAFEATITYTESINPAEAMWNKDGQDVLRDPVVRPMRANKGETSDHVAFTPNGKVPVWRRTNVVPVGKDDSDILLDKAYFPREQYDTYATDLLKPVEATAKMGAEELTS